MDRPFVAENAHERERLRLLVERLTDEELSLPMKAGWTIAVALAHLAYWDQRSLMLMRKWQREGVEPSSIDIDVTNDSLLPLLLAIPPGDAADLAVSAAEAIDRELENASSELIAAIESLGEDFRLYRSIHRKLHLDAIEDLLRNRDKI
ncbi:MAG: maleylpyruvate isomerase N-terminal domain-containing protein [Deltaproteobacteria bacterium]|nr:maleylpyruvate isomerase N-terminal domain-containing protein [Deltaproteobacteria bacterium]